MEREEKRVIVKAAYNYVQLGKLDRALEEYKKLVAIDPMDFLVHSMIAEIYAKKGEKGQAISEFLKAGNLLQATNNLEKAVHAFNHILKLDPSHAEAQAKIGEIVRTRMVEIDDLLRRGFVSNAAEMCDRLLQRLPQHPELEKKLAEIERAGNAGARGAEVRTDEHANQEMLANLLLMAQQYEKQESWEEAVEAYITILRLQPKNEQAQERLRDIYRHFSRQEKSRTVWDRISAERQQNVEQAKQMAKSQEKPQTESTVTRLMNRIAQESGTPLKTPPAPKDLDLLRQQAEEKLRLAVQDRRERERQKAVPTEDATSRQAEAEQESNVQLLLTQAQMYVQQNLLADAMRLAQNILEQDPQNKDVRGILLQIFQKKNL